MPKSKDNPAQLHLRLNFNNPTPAVLRNIATLMEISEESYSSGSAAPDIPNLEGGYQSDFGNPDVAAGQMVRRATLRRLVGCVSITTKRDWHEVWVLAYHEFFKRTGVHPVTESIRAGMKTHLDYVFADVSWPGILHDVLDEMLTGEAQ